MKTMRLLLLWTLSLMLCWSCSSDDKKQEEIVPPVLEVSQQALRFGNGRDTAALEIICNGPWNLESNVAWCKPSVTTGTGNAKVQLLLQENDGEKMRYAKLLVKGQGLVREITVIQVGLSLEIDHTTLSGEKEGGTFDVQIYCNGPWQVECDSAWVLIAPLSGQDTGSFTITLPANPLRARRTEIRVKARTLEKTIRLQQSGSNGAWYAEGQVRIYREEDAGNPVKIAFMGDGFIEEDLFPGEAYDRAMEEAIQAYFAVEPYKSYREYFCPYIVYACSEQRGASSKDKNGQIRDKRNTVFSVTIKDGETAMDANRDKVVSYARKIPGMVTQQGAIVVISNDSRYAGTCIQWSDGQTIALIPMNRDAQPPGGVEHLVAHEGAGHGFGMLADEYVNDSGYLPQAKVEELKNWQRSGLYLNVTSTQDTATVFWHDFIGRSGYALAGFFEGAHYYKKGIWRSESKNCMVNNIQYFSIACRLAIVQRIKRIAGESFDLEDFIRRDVQKEPTPEQMRTRSYAPAYYPLPTPPILIKSR